MKFAHQMIRIVTDTCVNVRKAMKPVSSAKKWRSTQLTVKRWQQSRLHIFVATSMSVPHHHCVTHVQLTQVWFFYKYVNLCRHLVCTDLPGSPFTCSCVAGYEDSTGGLDPAVPACVNRNECIGFVCNSLASCEDTEGSFVCNCPVGFSGDGITGCSNVDECTQDPSPCSAPAVCIGQLISIQHRRRNHTFKIRWVHSRVFVQLVLLLPMMAPVWMSTSAHLVDTTVKRVKRVWIYLEVSLVSVSSTLKILVTVFWV